MRGYDIYKGKITPIIFMFISGIQIAAFAQNKKGWREKRGFEFVKDADVILKGWGLDSGFVILIPNNNKKEEKDYKHFKHYRGIKLIANPKINEQEEKLSRAFKFKLIIRSVKGENFLLFVKFAAKR